MPTVVLAMLAILLVAVLIIAIVVVGMRGAGRNRAPDLADVMARTARQLNGDGQPPRGLLLLFNEMDEVSASELNPRQITNKIRSSIASARSAVSAQSPTPPPVVADGEHGATTQAAEPAHSGVDAGSATADEDRAEAQPLPPIPLDDPYGLTTPAKVADPNDPYGLTSATTHEDAGPSENGTHREPHTDTDSVVRVDLPHASSRH